MTRRQPEAHPAPLQAWQVPLHVTTSHRGIFWERTTNKSMPNIEGGPINFSVIQPQTCERIACQARNAQLWRRLGFCCADAPPPSTSPLSLPLATISLYPNSCPHSLHATDATGRFYWQIAFSRWFFKPRWYFNFWIQRFILCSGSGMCAPLAIHVQFFFFQHLKNV